MNYDEARAIENKETGEIVGWRWTSKNDGHIRTAWPCIDFAPMAPEDYGRKEPERTHLCPPHPTKEEAERHFYDACLAEIKESASLNWCDCRKCGAPTKRLLGNRDYGSLFSSEPLCDEHCNAESLTDLHPFKTGIYLIHS